MEIKKATRMEDGLRRFDIHLFKIAARDKEYNGNGQA